METPDLETPERFPIVRSIAQIIVTGSVSSVVSVAIKNNVTPESKLQKTQLYVGAWVLGSMVASAAGDYIDTKIDKIADAWDEFKNPDESTPEITDPS